MTVDGVCVNSGAGYVLLAGHTRATSVPDLAMRSKYQLFNAKLPNVCVSVGMTRQMTF